MPVVLPNSSPAATSTAPTPANGRAADRTETDAGETAARLRLSVTRLARLLRQQSDTRLTPTQISALATLQRCGPIPVGALADAEQIAAPTATKVVEKLHDAGLVARQGDPGDRRVTLLSVTRDGAHLLDDARSRKTAWLTSRLEELSPDDATRLTLAVDVLERLTMAPEPDR